MPLLLFWCSIVSTNPCLSVVHVSIGHTIRMSLACHKKRVKGTPDRTPKAVSWSVIVRLTDTSKCITYTVSVRRILSQQNKMIFFITASMTNSIIQVTHSIQSDSKLRAFSQKYQMPRSWTTSTDRTYHDRSQNLKTSLFLTIKKLDIDSSCQYST